MSRYKFNGDWKFDLFLPELSKIHSEKWFKSSHHVHHKNKLINGLVPCQIVDERNLFPDPTLEQEAALNYLLNHEIELVNSLFLIFSEKINKQYAEWCGEEDWFSEFNTVDDLGKLLGINGIAVLLNHKENQSYLQIDFEYEGDPEHGIALIMHKNILIGFSGIGDMGYECIYKDLGLDEAKAYESLRESREFGSNIVHTPIEKYGKFKPWQLNSTEEYFSKLLRNKENLKLKDEIESNNWNINIRFNVTEKNLVDIATYANNSEMIDYLIDKGGDFSRSMLQCTDIYSIKKDAIETLIKNGASIDILGYWGVTPLHNAILNYAGLLAEKKSSENLDIETEALKKLDNAKEIVSYYLSLGANPEKLDGEDSDYKKILRNRWSSEYLKMHLIEDHISELIRNEN